MENNLANRETLGQFVDQLLAQTAAEDGEFSPEERADYREMLIANLDDQIMTSVLSRLTEGQLAEFNQLLDRNEDDETAFKAFFDKCGLNLPEIVTAAMRDFGANFLGAAPASEPISEPAPEQPALQPEGDQNA